MFEIVIFNLFTDYTFCAYFRVNLDRWVFIEKTAKTSRKLPLLTVIASLKTSVGLLSLSDQSPFAFARWLKHRFGAQLVSLIITEQTGFSIFSFLSLSTPLSFSWECLLYFSPPDYLIKKKVPILLLKLSYYFSSRNELELQLWGKWKNLPEKKNKILEIRFRYRWCVMQKIFSQLGFKKIPKIT